MSLNFNNNDILCVKTLIIYPLFLFLQRYRNVIPQHLNSLLRLVVAKWTFAVWYATKMINYHSNAVTISKLTVHLQLLHKIIFFVNDSFGRMPEVRACYPLEIKSPPSL